MRSEESSPRCTTPLHVLLLRCGPDALHLASSTHQSGYTTCKQNLGKCVKMYRFFSLSLVYAGEAKEGTHTRAHTHIRAHIHKSLCSKGFPEQPGSHRDGARVAPYAKTALPKVSETDSVSVIHPYGGCDNKSLKPPCSCTPPCVFLHWRAAWTKRERERGGGAANAFFTVTMQCTHRRCKRSRLQDNSTSLSECKCIQYA